MTAALETLQLKKSYQKTTVLKGISFQVQPGRVTGLIGPNGCGKTTLIKSLLGLVIPDSGDILVQGINTKNGWAYRKNIGYMPQNPEFPAQLTVLEILDLMQDVRETKAPLRESLIRLFELESSLKKPFGVLSGGTKQKVATVAAFMFDPDILILDEPTVGLDPVSALKFKDLVRQSAERGKAVLLVSHVMSEMQQLVDDMIFLLDGLVYFAGTTASILQRAQTENNLEKAVVKLLQQSEARHV